MEEGMKMVDSTMAIKERWVAISTFVDGKNGKECYLRYREIVAKLKK
jgi:hypothetical protein